MQRHGEGGNRGAIIQGTSNGETRLSRSHPVTSEPLSARASSLGVSLDRSRAAHAAGHHEMPVGYDLDVKVIEPGLAQLSLHLVGAVGGEQRMQEVVT